MSKKKNGKITMGDLVSSGQALNDLLAKPLKPLVAFRLSQVVREIQPKLEDFDKSRKPVFDKWGEEKDGQIIVNQDKIEAFAEEYNPLLAEEVKMDLPEVTIADLGDAEISAKDLLSLGWLIKE